MEPRRLHSRLHLTCLMLMLFSLAVFSHHVWFVFDAHLVLISLALHNFHFVMPGSSYLVFGETE